MAGACGRVFRIDPRIVNSSCNALEETAAGWLVPETVLEAGPGIRVTPPVDGACPQVWRVETDASWAQARWNQPNSTHPLNGADRVYEQITEVPAITIPRAGAWDVSYSARAVTSLPATTAGSQFVIVALFKNGALIGGSEAIVGLTSGAGDAAKSVQAHATQRFVHGYAAGDVVTLHAYRLGQAGTAAVASTSDGRTWVTAHWIGPAGDDAG